MGKSDSIVFAEYRELLRGISADSVAFLGFQGENEFTRSIDARVRSFYDLALGNWDINSQWSLVDSFDLVVSTRCPYFASDPADFVNRCVAHTRPGGHVLLDWGLGDHWRFPNFKVGWVKDGEHEWAYNENNKLYSCFWRDEFSDEPEVKAFWDAVRLLHKYECSSVTDVIRQEVPAIVVYAYEKIRFKFLWPDSPQLYIMTLIKAK